MAKKSFMGGLNSLLAETDQSPVNSDSGGLSILLGGTKQSPVVKSIRERRITTTMEKNTIEAGVKEGEVSSIFDVKIELFEKIKAIAYWEHQQTEAVINNFLKEGITKYEIKHGPVKPMP